MTKKQDDARAASIVNPRPNVGLIPEERTTSPRATMTDREVTDARRRWQADAFEEGILEGRRRERDDHEDGRDSGWLMLIMGILVGVAMAGAYIWIYKLIVE